MQLKDYKTIDYIGTMGVLPFSNAVRKLRISSLANKKGETDEEPRRTYSHRRSVLCTAPTARLGTHSSLQSSDNALECQIL